MKKPGIIMTILLLYLFSSAQVVAAEETEEARFHEVTFIAEQDQAYLDLHLIMENTAAFSGAEFAIKLEGNLLPISIQYNQAITANKRSFFEKNGIYYFGFYGTENKYSGDLEVGTIRFSYQGNAPASVSIVETNLTTVEHISAYKRTITSGSVVDVSRAAGEDSGDPEDDNNSGDDQDTGNGEQPVDDGEEPGDNGDGSDNGEQPGGGGEQPVEPSPEYIHIIPQVVPKGNGTQSVIRLEYEAMLQAYENAQSAVEGTKRVVIQMDSGEQHTEEYLLEMPSLWFNPEKQQNLTLETPIGAVTLSSLMLGQIETAPDRYVSVHLSQAEISGWPEEVRAQLGSRPVLEIYLSIEGNKIDWSNKDVKVHVSIPYQPSPEESAHPDRIIIYYVDADHQLQVVKNGRYHQDSGSVTFSVDHLSSFVVGYGIKSFEDSLNSWAKSEIEALAIRGIINGVTSTLFSPDVNITRADFLKLLTGIMDLDVSFSNVESFVDVSPDNYYYESVMTARSFGLAHGTGDNRFHPESPISRQDMFVLLDRAFLLAGEAIAFQESETTFKDWELVSEYALSSAVKLTAAGLIQGNEGQLRPLDPLTRAEAARILYLMYVNLYPSDRL